MTSRWNSLWLAILLPAAGAASAEVVRDDFEQWTNGAPVGWNYHGPTGDLQQTGVGRGRYYSAIPATNTPCLLERSDPLSVTPRHHYALDVDILGGQYTSWSASLQLLGAAGWTNELYLIDGANPPGAVWERWRYYFVVPDGVSAIQPRFENTLYSPKLLARPGLDNLVIIDLGAVPLAATPLPNAWVNPGLELPLDEKGNAPGWPANSPSTEVVTDPVGAHSGQRFYRVKQRALLQLPKTGLDHRQSPIICHVSIWARGTGTFYFTMPTYSANLQRMFNVTSPRFTLTADWQKFEADICFAEGYPTTQSAWMMLSSDDQVDYDDAYLRRLTQVYDDEDR